MTEQNDWVERNFHFDISRCRINPFQEWAAHSSEERCETCERRKALLEEKPDVELVGTLYGLPVYKAETLKVGTIILGSLTSAVKVTNVGLNEET